MGVVSGRLSGGGTLGREGYSRWKVQPRRKLGALEGWTGASVVDLCPVPQLPPGEQDASFICGDPGAAVSILRHQGALRDSVSSLFPLPRESQGQGPLESAKYQAMSTDPSPCL